MSESHNSLLRFMFVLVGLAVAIRVAWLLISPLLPEIAIVLAAIVIWRLLRWHRERW